MCRPMREHTHSLKIVYEIHEDVMVFVYIETKEETIFLRRIKLIDVLKNLNKGNAIRCDR